MKNRPIFAKKPENSMEKFYKSELGKEIEEIIDKLVKLRVKNQKLKWKIEQLKYQDALAKQYLDELEKDINELKKQNDQKELELETSRSIPYDVK